MAVYSNILEMTCYVAPFSLLLQLCHQSELDLDNYVIMIYNCPSKQWFPTQNTEFVHFNLCS